MSDRKRREFEHAALVHLPALLRMALRQCGHRETAEDIVQETYLQAWRSFDRFVPGTNCRAWLYRILFFCLARDRRTRGRQLQTVDLDTASEQALRFDPVTPDVLTVESVRQAFERIADPFRTVMALVDLEQFSYREASDILGVPIGTVMSRLSRGRRLLRHELAQMEGDAAAPAAPSRKATIES
jgi:RNA polymerase sigma-70 factor (ECF subfamily)